VYAPLVFEHVPAPQIPGVFVHSFTSTQVAESPLPEAW
jgi:hypothetical protein